MTRHQLIGTITLIVVIAAAVALYRWVSEQASQPDPQWQVIVDNYTPPVVDSIDVADSAKRVASISDTAPPKRAKAAKKNKAATPPPPDRDAFNDMMKQDSRQ